MSSETNNALAVSLTELHDKLQKLDGEARRLGELRDDLETVAIGHHAVITGLQSVVVAMNDGAATMRKLDMGATLKRLEQIENTLDARSHEREKTMSRTLVELVESLKQQMSKQHDGLPARIGPAVAREFDAQFKTTNEAIDSFVTGASANQRALIAALNAMLGSLRKAHSEQLTLVTRALTDAESRNTTQANLLEAAVSKQLTLVTRALTDAESRNTTQANLLEAAVLTSTSKTRLMATLAFVVAGLGAIASVIQIFVRT